MDADVIRTHGLGKRYGGKQALHQLDLALPAGQVHAIVGANGAGKSTLFRILLGFLAPSEGHATILGRDCARLRPQDRARIGFVNEEHTLPAWMRVRQLVAMQRRHYPRWRQPAYDEVIGHYHVRDAQRVGQLSRGERAGLNLAMALAQSPDLLILDEPTLGLDVVAKRAFLEALLHGNAARGCTVVYCSHQMEEVERVADNLVILESGRLRHTGAPDDFCERVWHWIADIPFRAPDPATLPGLLQHQQIDGLHHYLVFDQGERFGSVLRLAGARHVQHAAVGLDRAVNAFLSTHHAAPAAA